MKIESFDRLSKRWAPLLEKALKKYLPPNSVVPREVHEAMRYAVLNGGKRFRPLLALSACEAVGGDPKEALLPACAVEMIHAYSLVHDDLPALDNDEMRRGIPTCHKKFGEAIAILTGDALLTRAFELLSKVTPPQKAVALIRELANAAGTYGMIGGQVVDILNSKNGSAEGLSLLTLDFISRHKTGKLIQASAVLGAIIGTNSASKIKQIREFGESLGLAFQVVDDIMDGDGYLRVINFQTAQQKAQQLIQRSKKRAERFGIKGRFLLGLADSLSQSLSSNLLVTNPV